MKVLHVAIMRFTRDTPEPVVLCQEADLSSFGFFEKSTVKQMLQFFSKTVVSRVKAGQRVTIEQEQLKEYQVHCFVNSEGLAATTTCDKEYPALADALKRAQDPAAFDKIIKIQNDLDD